jgi:metallo-beta-lactamase class B
MIPTNPKLAVAAALALGAGIAPARTLPAPSSARAAAAPSAGPDHAAFARIADQCRGKDGFADPAPPARVFGSAARNPAQSGVYYVGTCTVTVLLVTSPRGHVLIDAATHEAVPSILANIRALGFAPHDIRWIVTSHEHFDHVGGLADMVRATGARVAARAAALPVLTSGKVDPADPQAQKIAGFAPVKVDRVVADGERVMLAGMAFTASATPGHTAGSTSWSWTTCAGADCRRFDYVDSISAFALGTYRMSDHPAIIATFRATFARVAARPCGVLLTPHPVASDMFARLSGAKPLATPGDCPAYAATGAKRLDDLLAAEAAGPKTPPRL